MLCVLHLTIIQVKKMQQWFVESLVMKELLLLVDDIDNRDMSISFGILFTAVEMKTLYLTVASAVLTNFMRATIVDMYLHMHVKVSPTCNWLHIMHHYQVPYMDM